MSLPVLPEPAPCGSACRCASDMASRPLKGHPIRGHIASTVKGIVLSRHGAAQAVTGEELAALVRVALDLGGWLSDKTILRRCQESIAALVAAGERIASTSADGYYVPETAEEIEAGARDLRHRLIGIAKRLRSYDRHTADRILELLGQAALDLSTEAA
jgi:hypothetical protein